MKTFEKVPIWVRHLPLLEHADWLWNLLRPIHRLTVGYFGRNGLERVVNGSDRILISPQMRGMSEVYEPDVWRILLSELRIGDTFVDVGAFVGLYAIAVASRLHGTGRIVAFEPDSHNFSILQEHIRLNGFQGQMELHQSAVSDQVGQSCFLAGHSCESRLVQLSANHSTMVQVVTLDSVFEGERIDILKIDVEGYEEWVLRGACDLLRSPSRRPRAIFIEVHPCAWPSLGTTSARLLTLLNSIGYTAETIYGEPVREIEQYGEIVARIAS
jgi:FkbM family methyltransferase